MPDVTFCWVGGQIFGPATASYFPTRRSALRAPRNIIFAGQRARSEVFSYLASADVFFLPSYHENCPMAVLEAAATGLPLVLRDLPQYLELFGNASLYGSEDMFPAIIRRCLTDESLKLTFLTTPCNLRNDSIRNRRQRDCCLFTDCSPILTTGETLGWLTAGSESGFIQTQPFRGLMA